MSEVYRIDDQDLANRLIRVPDLEAFGKEHGLARISETFGVDDLYPPNAGQENCRRALRALGYDFADDESVWIVHGDLPLCDE